MNRTILVVLFLQAQLLQKSFVSAVPQSDQQPVRAHFHWDWKDWQELSAKQSLRKAKIPYTQKKAIAQAIADDLRPMCLGPEASCVTVPASSIGEITSEAELQQAVLETRTTLIDLNDDGVPEVMAQGMVNCGATGNCPFWVLRKTKEGYEIILEGEAQTFTIQPSTSNGFRDIVLSTHESYSSGGLTLYQYKEGFYTDLASYRYDWTVLEGDKVRELKEPHVTPCR